MLAGSMQRLDYGRLGAEPLLEFLRIRAGREVDVHQRLERVAKRGIVEGRAVPGDDTTLLEPPQPLTSRARAQMHLLGELLESHATAAGHHCEDCAVHGVHSREFYGDIGHL